MSDLLDVLTDVRRDAERASRLACTTRSAAAAAPPCTGSGLLGGTGPVLRDTLLRRRSRRFFTDAAVGLDDLTEMVGDGLRMDAVLFPELHDQQPLEVFLAARCVTGLSPAIYSLAAPLPVRLAELPAADGLAGMVLQPEFAQAAALLVVTGSLAAAVGRHGGHGHRLLLERSGAVAETAWLTGVGRGLGGSIFAGFLPTALRALAGVDGFHRTQLLALAIGHPSDTPGSDAASDSG